MEAVYEWIVCAKFKAIHYVLLFIDYVCYKMLFVSKL